MNQPHHQRHSRHFLRLQNQHLFCPTCTHKRKCSASCNFCFDPTNEPTPSPTTLPTFPPTAEPTLVPIPMPTRLPVPAPTSKPTALPTFSQAPTLNSYKDNSKPPTSQPVPL